MYLSLTESSTNSKEVISVRLRKCSMKREEIVAAGGAHCDGGSFFGCLV